VSTPVADRPGTAEGALAVPDDHVIVLFGATGDLAGRKLLPGLLHLAQSGLMPADFRVVAVSRDDMDDDGFRAHARAAADEFGRAGTDGWEDFARRLSYLPAGDPTALGAAVARAREGMPAGSRLLHYLSVPPSAFGAIARDLGAAGLAEGARVIMEKPFGTDLASARALNETVHEVFAEDQVFRIDHFLGKEAVQNLLALRFANGLFEPIWNRQHIAHVQIDVPETLSIGTRAAFYEPTGALRDMVVTHLLQVLGFVAMEPPTALEPGPLVDEKAKVFQSLRPLVADDVVRGQYDGYRDEPGVASDSQTETFVAVRAHIDNWRWEGVPFYLRTGKRMAATRRLLTLAFREPPRRIFPDACRPHVGTDRLVIDFGDPGSVTAHMAVKTPGPTFDVAPAEMRLAFAGDGLLEAYERLIHDAMLGDHTLFTRADGIERLWEVCSGVLEDPPPVVPYTPGGWGPPAAEELVPWTLR
jgi:glucose-6-phosphate 1-dehydrogenase